jgi:hypothetical protein
MEKEMTSPTTIAPAFREIDQRIRTPQDVVRAIDERLFPMLDEFFKREQQVSEMLGLQSELRYIPGHVKWRPYFKDVDVKLYPDRKALEGDSAEGSVQIAGAHTKSDYDPRKPSIHVSPYGIEIHGKNPSQQFFLQTVRYKLLPEEQGIIEISNGQWTMRRNASDIDAVVDEIYNELSRGLQQRMSPEAAVYFRHNPEAGALRLDGQN